MKKSELEATIESLRQENHIQSENFIRFMMGGPCDKHSGENTPQIDDFLDLIRGKCMLCLIEENKQLKEQIVVYKRSIEIGDDR